MWGKAPHLKGGPGGKTPSLGCFCAYIGGCRGISAPFYFPHPKPPGPACWVVGRALLKFLLIITPKSVVGRVLLKFLLIITTKARVFNGKHRKNDADLSTTSTKQVSHNYKAR